MQVDWISAAVSPRQSIDEDIGPYHSGVVGRIIPDQEPERMYTNHIRASSNDLFLAPKLREALASPGSYDTRLSHRSPDGHEIWLSGNPVKFYQGHNLFGPTDADGLFLAMGVPFIEHEQGRFFPGPDQFREAQYGRPRYTRLDITRSYRFATQKHANAWLRDVAATGQSRHGSPLVHEGSVRYGRGSSYWSLNIYAKLPEMRARGKGHAPRPTIAPRERRKLYEWADGVLRFEVTVRGRELKHFDSDNADLLLMWKEYFSRVTFNRNSEMTELGDQINKLTNTEAATYVRWREGMDPRASMSRPTFYRHRKSIMDKLGVDIASAPSKPEKREPEGEAVSELDPNGWDPEAIEGLTFGECEYLRNQYGYSRGE